MHYEKWETNATDAELKLAEDIMLAESSLIGIFEYPHYI
jgi:hypothetical protein